MIKMSNSMPVKSALLHQPISIPGCAEKTLNATRIPGIKLTYVPQGLVVELKEHTVLIPTPNVAMMVIDSVEDK